MPESVRPPNRRGTMRWFVLALFAALLFPSWSVAMQPSRELREEQAVGVFLPGADVGTSPHATWQQGSDGPRLALVGVAGARLVVDEALILRIDDAAPRVSVRATVEGAENMGEFSLRFHKGDIDVGTLRLTDSSPALTLGDVHAGDTFHVTAVLSIPSDAAPDGRAFVRLWATSLPR